MPSNHPHRTRRALHTAGPGARGGLFVAALLIMLAACTPAGERGSEDATPASGQGEASGAPTAPTRSPTPGGSPSAGRFPIVAYQGAELLGAEELDFTDLLGRGTPVVLNFWAGQCPPCRAEMPAFQRVYDRHRDEVLLVGVDIGPYIGLGSHDDARQLLAELNITYPTAYAVDERAVRDYNIVGMPTTVFYTADGEEHRRHSGIITEEQFEAAVEEIVAAGS